MLFCEKDFFLDDSDRSKLSSKMEGLNSQGKKRVRFDLSSISPVHTPTRVKSLGNTPERQSPHTPLMGNKSTHNSTDTTVDSSLESACPKNIVAGKGVR
mgnify:CR=1 FL=1